MALVAVLETLRKELRSLARDRHTLLWSVALPAFLYPGLLLGMFEVMGYVEAIEERRVSRVAAGGDAAAGLEAFVGRLAAEREGGSAGDAPPGGERADRRAPRAAAGAAGGDGEATPRPDGPDGGAAARAARRMEIVPEAGGPWDAARARARLAPGDGDRSGTGRLDAIARAREGGPVAGIATRPVSVELFWSSARDGSRQAHDRVERVVAAWRRDRLETAVREGGADPRLLDPFRTEVESLATTEEVASHIAALVLPLLMTIMTAVGAFYPALECATGERERGTLETTLILPVPRWTVAAGKYLAVVLFALLAFGLNLGSMLLTLGHVASRLSLEGLSLSPGAVLLVLVAAVLLAAFLGAVLLLLAFLARTFKEGQTWVTPVYLLSLAPVVVLTDPEMRLTPGLAAVPLVGPSLLFRDALKGRAEPWPAAVCLATMALATVLAVLLASRLLGREQLTAGGGIAWRWPARFRRRGREGDVR